MSTLDEALRLAEAGIPVFPIRPHEKEPLTQNGFKSATTDTEKIREWWAWKPNANVGVPTGRESGVVCIDVDDPERPQEKIRELLDHVGLDELPEHVLHRTGKGGLHLLFRAPAWSVRSTQGVLTDIDTRGDGGYIVAAGRNGDGPYEPVNGRLGDEEPDPLPDAFRSLLQREEEEEGTLSGRREEAAGMLGAALSNANGHRHDLYLSLAGGLANAGWPDGDVLTFVRRVAHEAGDEEPEDRVRAAKDTLSRRDEMKPLSGWRSFRRELSKAVGGDEASHLTDEVRHTLGLWNANESEDEAHLLGGTVGELLKSGPPVFSWSETDPREAPEEEWLVEGLLPARGSHYFLAPPKSGKSQKIGHYEACLLTGSPVFGHYPVAKDDAKILHIMLEERKHTPRERIENNLRGMGWTDEEILSMEDTFSERFFSSSIDLEADNLEDAVFRIGQHSDWLLTLASTGFFDLIVLDPLRAAHRRSEDDSTDMQPVTDLMRKIARYTCFGIAHHTQKPNEDGEVRIGGAALRGTGDLDAARDDILQITDGRFGGSVVIGRFSRTDSDRFLSVQTEADDGVARWEFLSETDDPDGREILRGDGQLFNRLRQAEWPGGGLRKSLAKDYYGDRYGERLSTLVSDGKIEMRSIPNGRPGANPTYVTLAGQFGEDEWDAAEERLKELNDA